MGEMGNSTKLTRRLVLGALLGGAAGQALANAPLTSIRPKPGANDYVKRAARSVDVLLNEANLTGKVGFVVADARTGKILETKNPLLPLPLRA